MKFQLLVEAYLFTVSFSFRVIESGERIYMK